MTCNEDNLSLLILWQSGLSSLFLGATNTKLVQERMNFLSLLGVILLISYADGGNLDNNLKDRASLFHFDHWRDNLLTHFDQSQKSINLGYVVPILEDLNMLFGTLSQESRIASRNGAQFSETITLAKTAIRNRLEELTRFSTQKVISNLYHPSTLSVGDANYEGYGECSKDLDAFLQPLTNPLANILLPECNSISVSNTSCRNGTLPRIPWQPWATKCEYTHFARGWLCLIWYTMWLCVLELSTAHTLDWSC